MFFFVTWRVGPSGIRRAKTALKGVLVIVLIAWIVGSVYHPGIPSIPQPTPPPAGLTPSNPRFCALLNNHITNDYWQNLWDEDCMSNPNYNPDTNKHTNGN